MERVDNRTKKQKEGRFCWLDWVIVILLVAGVLGGFFAVRYLFAQTDGADGEILYTVRIAAIDPARYPSKESLFEVGSSVRSQNGTLYLGEVQSVRWQVNRSAYAEDGEIHIAESPDLYDCYVTVKSAASKREGDGIRVSDVRVAAGMTLTLRIGDTYAENVQVIDLEWEETEDA